MYFYPQPRVFNLTHAPNSRKKIVSKNSTNLSKDSNHKTKFFPNDACSILKFEPTFVWNSLSLMPPLKKKWMGTKDWKLEHLEVLSIQKRIFCKQTQKFRQGWKCSDPQETF